MSHPYIIAVIVCSVLLCAFAYSFCCSYCTRQGGQSRVRAHLTGARGGGGGARVEGFGHNQ